jgi:hypothetical protein
MVYFNHETYNTFVELLHELDLDPNMSDEIKQRICIAAKFDPNRAPPKMSSRERTKHTGETEAERRRAAVKKYKEHNIEAIREQARIHMREKRAQARLNSIKEILC